MIAATRLQATARGGARGGCGSWQRRTRRGARARGSGDSSDLPRALGAARAGELEAALGPDAWQRGGGDRGAAPAAKGRWRLAGGGGRGGLGGAPAEALQRRWRWLDSRPLRPNLLTVIVDPPDGGGALMVVSTSTTRRRASRAGKLDAPGLEARSHFSLLDRSEQASSDGPPRRRSSAPTPCAPAPRREWLHDPFADRPLLPCAAGLCERLCPAHPARALAGPDLDGGDGGEEDEDDDGDDGDGGTGARRGWCLCSAPPSSLMAGRSRRSSLCTLAAPPPFPLPTVAVAAVAEAAAEGGAARRSGRHAAAVFTPRWWAAAARPWPWRRRRRRRRWRRRCGRRWRRAEAAWVGGSFLGSYSLELPDDTWRGVARCSRVPSASAARCCYESRPALCWFRHPQSRRSRRSTTPPDRRLAELLLRAPRQPSPRPGRRFRRGRGGGSIA